MLSYSGLIVEAKKSVTTHVGTISEYGLQDVVDSYLKLVKQHLNSQGITDPSKADRATHNRAHVAALNAISDSEDIARLRPSRIKPPEKDKYKKLGRKPTASEDARDRRNTRINAAYNAMGHKDFHDTAYDVRNSAQDIIHDVYTHGGRIMSGHFAGTLGTKGMQRLIHGKEEGEVPSKADLLFKIQPHEGGDPTWFSASLKTDKFKSRQTQTLKEAVMEYLIETKISTLTPKGFAERLSSLDPSLGKDLQAIDTRHYKKMDEYINQNKGLLDKHFSDLPADHPAKKHYQTDAKGRVRLLQDARSHIRDVVRPAEMKNSEMGKFYAGMKSLQNAHGQETNARLERVTQAMIDSPDRQKHFDSILGTQRAFKERMYTMIRNSRVKRGWNRTRTKATDPTKVDWSKRKFTMKGYGNKKQSHSVYMEGKPKKAAYRIGADFSRGGEIRYNMYVNHDVFK